MSADGTFLNRLEVPDPCYVVTDGRRFLGILSHMGRLTRFLPTETAPTPSQQVGQTVNAGVYMLNLALTRAKGVAARVWALFGR